MSSAQLERPKGVGHFCSWQVCLHLQARQEKPYIHISFLTDLETFIWKLNRKVQSKALELNLALSTGGWTVSAARSSCTLQTSTNCRATNPLIYHKLDDSPIFALLYNCSHLTWTKWDDGSLLFLTLCWSENIHASKPRSAHVPLFGTKENLHLSVLIRVQPPRSSDMHW